MQYSDMTVDLRHQMSAQPIALTTPEGGNPVAWFFALDTDGRVAWPFRYVRQADGRLEPQRWRFGKWISSGSLRAFMTGEDDQFVEAGRLEVESWIQRHSQSWHPAIHHAERQRAPAA